MSTEPVQDQLKSIIQKTRESEGCNTQDALRDLLTDLRHVAADTNLCFDTAVEGSGEVFKEEEDLEPTKQQPTAATETKC